MTVLFQEIQDLSKDECIGLLGDASINRLAHNGLWFQAVEKIFGTKPAILFNQQV
jgi:hypothetical protein